ncbi:MAG: hypothetical protein A2675_02790 [Candidatus Yonathbacteria bacterium RIFCSPHIGHO2_01_FULL_51_10]|uniref:Uncharacterized protein n=1 Tax=Candidatus Yonathbacteria bacterium RIFCSPHIGHO2_01_FULL_51_10 TaxID=1802723 RepID=A0A1G2S8P6_9BACT|nr:MAG: hypothetical protein A2675_02790 [Candidatus Yonathbacteria bacterium RIFCSPHIGHO2_01_FULL_51_10]
MVRGRNTVREQILQAPARIERRRREAKRRMVLGGLAVVGVIVLVLGLSWVLHRSTLRIQTVVVSGAQVLDQHEVASFAQETLAGNDLYLFPKDSAFIYSDAALIKALMQKFPRIATVQLTLKGLTELDVTITERVPAALWCGEAYQSQPNATPCYFLDEKGMVFATAPKFSGNAYLVLYGALSSTSSLPGAPLPFGQTFLSSGEFASVMQFAVTAGALLTPAAAYIVVPGARSLVLSQGAYILMSLGQDLASLSQSLTAAVNAKRAEGKHDLATDLDYIDLRIADTASKVYFKFKN